MHLGQQIQAASGIETHLGMEEPYRQVVLVVDLPGSYHLVDSNSWDRQIQEVLVQEDILAFLNQVGIPLVVVSVDLVAAFGGDQVANG